MKSIILSRLTHMFHLPLTIGFSFKSIRNFILREQKKWRLDQYKLCLFMIQINSKRNWGISMIIGKAIFNQLSRYALIWMYLIRSFHFRIFFTVTKTCWLIISLSKHFADNLFSLVKLKSFIQLIFKNQWYKLTKKNS